MSDTPTTQHRPGWSGPFGHPAPDDELELRPEHGIYTGEAPQEAGPEPVPADDGGGYPPDRPHLVQVGNRPNPDYPHDPELMRRQREHQIDQGGVVARPSDAGAERPVRQHVEYHVVLTERRGARRWAPRNVIVGAGAPVQILGLNQNRKRAIIRIATSTPDGYFVALGLEASLPGAGASTTFTAGVAAAIPEVLRQADLVPLMVPAASPVPFSPTSFVIEHVREVWALFVPDTVLASKGQFAVVSISEEVGDPALAEDETVRPGKGGDR